MSQIKQIVMFESAFSDKYVSERAYLETNYIKKLQTGETISSCTVTPTVLSGTDASPSALKSGSAVISGAIVRQLIIGGVAGVTYNLAWAVTTSLRSFTFNTEITVIADPS